MTPYYDRSEWPAFLAAIRAAPDDDLPRLVAADFIEESGDAERAEFIRRQIELFRMDGSLALDSRRDAVRQWLNRVIDDGCLAVWIESHEDWSWSGDEAETWVDARDVSCGVSRGFVHTVRGPLGVLHGDECGCGGWPVTGPASRALGPSTEPIGTDGECATCHGIGRTPGVIGELLRREPITAAGVEVTQASPVGVVPNEYPRNGTGPERSWAWRGAESTPYDGYMIPRDVWDLMPPTTLTDPPGRFKVYATPDAARLALGEALIRLHGPKIEVTT